MADSKAELEAENARHAILRQMGVDVWLLRRRADEALPGLSAPGGQVVAGAREQPTVQTDSVKAALKATAVGKGRGLPPAETTSTPVRSAGRPVAPFSVFCLSKGPVLMLVELGPSKAARRFALDVLAASSGIYGGDTAQLAFEWPQPGVDNNPQTLKKALGAFVAKQLSDQAPSRVLIGQEVSARLEQIPDGSIELAPLAELMVDGERKRALWAELEGR
jgi:hypothetical protein